jgi:hypothetical protein
VTVVSFGIAPTSIDTTGGTRTVTYNITIVGQYTAGSTAPKCSIYLTPPAGTSCSAKIITGFTPFRIEGANTVYQFRDSYTTSELCAGVYTLGAVSCDDQYGSRNVYGSCTSSTVCGDTRNPTSTPSGLASSVQLSSLALVLAAVVAALLPN